MRRSIVQNILCWGLLLYLAAFIIPPLSSITQAFKTVPGNRNSAKLVKDYQHTTLYLYDLLLWQSLKTSRHTAKQVLSAPEKAEIGDPHEGAPVITGTPGMTLSTYCIPEWYNLLLQHSRSADIRFTRSGISSPCLS
jgi:hypothetical protein